MEFPVMRVEEDGESYDYPLTFICQIDCEDIAPFDKEGQVRRTAACSTSSPPSSTWATTLRSTSE